MKKLLFLLPLLFLFFGSSSDNPVERYVEDNAIPAKVSFEFVTVEESYIFKFWQGVNAQGNVLFLNMEIPVNSNST